MEDRLDQWGTVYGPFFPYVCVFVLRTWHVVVSLLIAAFPIHCSSSDRVSASLCLPFFSAHYRVFLVTFLPSPPSFPCFSFPTTWYPTPKHIHTPTHTPTLTLAHPLTHAPAHSHSYSPARAERHRLYRRWSEPPYHINSFFRSGAWCGDEMQGQSSATPFFVARNSLFLF
jgi:hypothetical protein